MEIELRTFERDALCTFAAKEQMRFVLNNIEIRVEKERVILTATDGKRAISIEKKAAPEKSELGKYYILPVMLKALCIMHTRERFVPGSVKKRYKYGAIPLEIIRAVTQFSNQDYPKIENMIPSERNREIFILEALGNISLISAPFGISLSLLSGLATFITRGDFNCVKFYQENETEAIVGEIDADDYRATLVIMPLSIY